MYLRFLKLTRQLFLSGAKLQTILSLCLLISITNSCVESASNGKSKRGGGGIANTPSSVSPGYGRYMADNPIIVSNNTALSNTVSIATLLQPTQIFITNNQFLQESCTLGSTTISSCYEVYAAENTSFITAPENRWGFNAASTEFRQVNTMAHLNKIISRYETDVAYTFVQSQPPALSVIYPYQGTSIPASWLGSDNAFWFGSDSLTTYADCDIPDNASYDASTREICLGSLTGISNVFFSHDPTVTYHEVGHSFSDTFLNMRNQVDATLQNTSIRADIGYIFYDEGGAIGEGVADYFSYYTNNRKHVGEWALGRFLSQSRPLTEADPIHNGTLTTDSDNRYSYPAFVNYAPTEPTEEIEDVHVAGMIFSHFLVALTEDMQSYCGMSEYNAIQNIFYLLAETFGEIGDLTAQGTDDTTLLNYSINMNNDSVQSTEWLEKNNSINFRRVSQTLGRKFTTIFSDLSLARCNGGTYPVDRFEQLLDSYGLLLFSTYNKNGNHETGGHVGSNPVVNPSNKIKTVTVPKVLLTLDPTENSSPAFIIDDRATMISLASSLAGQLDETLSTLLIDDEQPELELPYNNGNNKISPGEFIGLALNLYNNSNSDMGGVQILANDWDHFSSTGQACPNFGDNFPSIAEGGKDISGESSSIPGECTHITRNNGTAGGSDTIAPVCFVQVSEDNATQWVSQSALMTKIGLDSSKCLRGSGSTSDCFVNFLEGGDQAVYSKIPPKSSWTSIKPTEAGVPQFTVNNLLFFETSPWIPPGTTFNCRFRTRFTNCSDCFEDSTNANDDYLDFQYAGGEPFKIINFQFTVTN